MFIGNFISFVRQFRVDHRCRDLNDLLGFWQEYDFIGLDRDGTLGGHHAPKPDPRILGVLQTISRRTEVVSNCAFCQLVKIRDIYAEMVSASIMVGFGEMGLPHLLRFEKGSGKLRVLRYYPTVGMLCDVTSRLAQGDALFEKPTRIYRKPNPWVLQAVVALAVREGRILARNPRVLYVGDKFFTDVRCANLAGFEAARVKTIGQLSDLREWRIDFVLERLLFDLPIGAILSRLADMFSAH